MRIRRLLPCACLLIGCATVPMAVAAQDLSAQQMAPPTGKALVYVYRSTLYGYGVKMSVTLDGKERGQIAPKTYVMWGLNPGEHEITSITKGIAGNTAKLRLRVEAGKTYFVQQKMGAWGTKLRLVDEKKGRKGVSKIDSRLAAKGLLPGNTGALPGLQQDTLRMLMMMDSVHDKDCKDRKVVNTETLESTLEQKERKIAVERWTVDRCGKQVAYPIVFSASPKGGTDFTIMSPTK